MTIQVTLIGGPADLQRHVVDDRLQYIQVASMDAHVAPYRHDDCRPIHNLSVTTHTYDIRQVDRNVFVGLWTGKHR